MTQRSLWQTSVIREHGSEHGGTVWRPNELRLSHMSTYWLYKTTMTLLSRDKVLADNGFHPRRVSFFYDDYIRVLITSGPLLDPITPGLVRDDFPCKIARNASETTDWEDMPKDSCVPLGFDDLFDWVKLQELPYSPDPTRKWEVVHVPQSPDDDTPSAPPQLQRMTVRIFGVIGNLNLMELGNWDRWAPS